MVELKGNVENRRIREGGRWRRGRGGGWEGEGEREGQDQQ